MHIIFYFLVFIENENVIELLLKHGADIDGKDAFSFTPLQYASVSDNIQALRILLKYSKDNIEVTNFITYKHCVFH